MGEHTSTQRVVGEKGRTTLGELIHAAVRSAIEAAVLTAISTEEDSPSPAWAERSRSSSSHRSAACSRSNSFTISSPWRWELSQWIRLIASPYT